ncbi:MAG: hypothetical protein NZ769_01170 [Anaerolineae bacterium]|nr:hypothetical protein [Anaerolineae bacterium]
MREIAVIPLENCDFRLVSGGYTLSLEGGHLRIRRTDGADGLAFATLGEWGWNLFPFIRQRRIERQEDGPRVTLIAERGDATFTLTFGADPSRPGLFRWRFAVTPQRPIRGAPECPELTFTAVPRATLYTQQAPMAAGLAYLYEEALLDSTLFYFQDFTALNDYFSRTQTRPMGGIFPSPLPHLPTGIVGLLGRDLGLALPDAAMAAFPTGAEIVFSQGYLALTPGRPADEPAMARRFLEDLAAIYRRIPHPPTELVGWKDLARRTLADLLDPRNWVEVKGKPFLRAYVNDERTTPELIAQLDVLTSLRAYCARHGHSPETRELDQRLSATLDYFYNSQIGTIINQPVTDYPVADSWYFVTGLVDLHRLARGGDAQARRILMDSVGRIIEVAHRYRYIFPIFVDPVGAIHPLQPDPPMCPPMEYDVAGGYAYLMLSLYEETGDALYLKEAQAAVEAMAGLGFDLAYELHVTAMAAAACARLFRLTGEPEYLDRSLLPLANFFRHCWLWECDYGHAKTYRTFFGLLPMTYAGVITPKEQYEAWISAAEYLRLAGEAAPDSVRMLLAEFCRHTLNTMRSALAPLRPPESVARVPRIHKSVSQNAPELYIPLEDVRDGWELSGEIGQELYGSGMALTFAADAYTDLKAGITLYSEYPLLRQDGKTFTLAGTPDQEVEVSLWGSVEGVADEAGHPVPLRREGDALRFRARGGQVYRIT